MNDMNTPGPTTTRPTLLTVLCILTFVFGGIGIISGIMGLLKDPQAEVEAAKAQMEQGLADAGDDAPAFLTTMMQDAIVAAEKQAENHMAITIVGLLCTLLSVFGAWKMWNLQKQGFTFYVIASVLSLGSTLYFLGASTTVLLGAGLMGLVSVVFIILYAVNLKHMH